MWTVPNEPEKSKGHGVCGDVNNLGGSTWAVITEPEKSKGHGVCADVSNIRGFNVGCSN